MLGGTDKRKLIYSEGNTVLKNKRKRKKINYKQLANEDDLLVDEQLCQKTSRNLLNIDKKTHKLNEDSDWDPDKHQNISEDSDWDLDIHEKPRSKKKKRNSGYKTLKHKKHKRMSVYTTEDHKKHDRIS